MRGMRWMTALALVLCLDAVADEPRIASLGDFPLEAGGTIRHCRIGYRTAGTLNADRSNAVVVLTWFAGHSGGLVPSIGERKLFDSSRWFVITIDALGDGISSSPSNSTTQPGAT